MLISLVFYHDEYYNVTSSLRIGLNKCIIRIRGVGEGGGRGALPPLKISKGRQKASERAPKSIGRGAAKLLNIALRAVFRNFSPGGRHFGPKYRPLGDIRSEERRVGKEC